MEDEFVLNGIPARAPSGFVLVDASLEVIHCNPVALEIFGYPEMEQAKPKLDRFIWEKLGTLFNGSASGEVSYVTEFVSGRRQYTCRAYSLTPGQAGLPNQHIAVVFERSSSIMSGLTQISRQFGLSPRESQVLRLALRGCCNKEMATELNLSPNTVKAFIRMVMVKMAVTTRARVVCKALNCLEELHHRELCDEVSHELDLVQAESPAAARLGAANHVSARMAPRSKANGNGHGDDAPEPPLVTGEEIFEVQETVQAPIKPPNGIANETKKVSDEAILLPRRFDPVGELAECDESWRGRFTPKETKILALLAEGSSCEEIAKKISAPERTVRDYLRGLLCTTGLSELSELAEFTLAHRLLDPPPKEY